MSEGDHVPKWQLALAHGRTHTCRATERPVGRKVPRERQGHPQLSLSEGTAATGDGGAPQKPALDGKGEVRLQGPRLSTYRQPACCEKFLCTPTAWPFTSSFTPRPCIPSGAASAISRGVGAGVVSENPDVDHRGDLRAVTSWQGKHCLHLLPCYKTRQTRRVGRNKKCIWPNTIPSEEL